MAIATSTILYKHFKGDEPIRVLISESKSTYEAALKKIKGLEFYHVPNNNISALNGLDFDLVISQDKKQQFGVLANIAQTLHIPIVSLECNLPGSPEDLRITFSSTANIHSYQTVAQAWQIPNSKTIYEPIEEIPFNDMKLYNTIFLDIDKTTLQIGQQLSQMYPIGQIPQDAQEMIVFNDAGIYVNLAAPNPDVLGRIRKALSAGCVVLTWNHPLFNELVVQGYNGYTFKSPDELVQQLNQLKTKNIDELKRMGRASSSLVKTKFSLSGFEKEWLKIIKEAIKPIFLGV
jgi:hypothetical protein